ncbi:MAG TPA: RNA polymerase sigma factor [Pirellulaceae bacterium]|nr:RNA polymerase sigma factor [Pirellulaceae bacterium]
MSTSDQAVVVRGLRTGDPTAWTSLYDHYSADLWRYVARLIGSDTNSVADLVQEVFLAAARSAAQFDPDRGSLWSWLTGIAHHQVANHWRQAKRQARVRELAKSQASALRYWLDSEQPLDDLWERRELADIVRAILADLPADYVALLTGKYIAGQSLDELAWQHCLTNDAVKSKLARARREFRARFEHWTRTSAAGHPQTAPPVKP